MCSARYLEENVVVEWRRAYINYRGLKKVIKRVEARRKARISRDLSRFSTRSSSNKSFASTLEGIRKRANVKGIGWTTDDEDADASLYATGRQGQSYGARGRGAGLTDDDEEDVTLPRVTLEGTGLALASYDDDGRKGKGSGSDTTRVSSGESGFQTSHARKDDSDIEANALAVPFQRIASSETQKAGPPTKEPPPFAASDSKPKKAKKDKKKCEYVRYAQLFIHAQSPFCAP